MEIVLAIICVLVCGYTLLALYFDYRLKKKYKEFKDRLDKW